jgi:hypothetical protein
MVGCDESAPMLASVPLVPLSDEAEEPPLLLLQAMNKSGKAPKVVVQMSVRMCMVIVFHDASRSRFPLEQGS